jgi:hypothetical protein
VLILRKEAKYSVTTIIRTDLKSDVFGPSNLSDCWISDKTGPFCKSPSNNEGGNTDRELGVLTTCLSFFQNKEIRLK